MSIPVKDWSHLSDAELASALFEYRDGALYWRVQKANNIRVGDRAGRLKQNRQRSRGSSRFVGVARHKQSGKWQATIGVGGRIIYLGLHASEDDARAAYLKAKAELHPMAPSVGV